MREKVTCPHCGGQKVILGVRPKDNQLCPACFGEGVVSSSRLKSGGEKVTVKRVKQ